MRFVPEQRIVWFIGKMQITELRDYIHGVKDPNLRRYAKHRLSKLRKARDVEQMTHAQVIKTAKKAFHTIDGLRSALKIARSHITALQQDLHNCHEEWRKHRPELRQPGDNEA